MLRPRPRPKKGNKNVSGAPMTSIRPKARPVEVSEEEAGAIERGNRASKRRAEEKMPMMKAGGMMKKGYKAGGKMPDLTGDGKVTQADVLKGRGAFKTGGMMKKGYKKGGKIRGAGKATKGVRAAKMVTMKGS